MKKWLAPLALIASLSLVVAACGSNGTNNSANPESPAGEETFKFRLGHVGAVNEYSAYQLSTEHFANQVAELTNGTVNIEIYPSGQLGGDRDMLESIQNGALDMGLISLAVVDGFSKNLSGIQLPFLVTDKDIEYQLYQSDVVNEALGTLEDLNVKGLALVPTGLRAFGTNGKAIEKPEDMKNQKIRAPESPMLLDAYKTLGMDTTPMPFPELYSALQTGVIQGMDQIVSTWWSGKYYEVTKNLSITNAYPWPGVLMVNLDKYNRMSDEQKQALITAAADTQKLMYESVVNDIDDKTLELLKAEINVVENVDPVPFREILQPVYDKYAGQNEYIKKTIEEVNKLIEGNP